MTSPANPLQVVRGACGHDCPDTCSWVVEVRDGTAERLSGDPAHPFTRGTLCAKVNHYLERVYHPDRVLHPLKRAGSKGEGRFVRVSWDEALADIASRWQAIAAESGAEAILPYSSAGVQGIIQEASLDRRLFGSMGCSGLDRNICGAVAAAGMSATIGYGTGIDPEEVVHSRFIVLWGTNTIVTNLHFWPLVREAQRRGAKVVVVDPDPHAHRRSRRLARADQARERCGAGAGDDARDDSRRPRRPRLRVAARHRVRSPGGARRSSTHRHRYRTPSDCRPRRSSDSPANMRRRSRRCCGR